MPKTILMIFLLSLILNPAPLSAQEDTDSAALTSTTGQEAPEGMEKIRLGGSAELIVPKGAKTRQVGAQVIVEGTKEYMSRRFAEMETRLNALEERQTATEKKLTEEIKMLRDELEQKETTDAQLIK